MSDLGKSGLKTKINAKVYDNNDQLITGDVLQEVMQDTVDTLANGGNLDNGSVGTANIADGAVTTAKIASEAVTTAKIADGAVNEDKIANDSVYYDNLQAGVKNGVGSVLNLSNADELYYADLATALGSVPTYVGLYKRTGMVITFATDAAHTNWETWRLDGPASGFATASNWHRVGTEEVSVSQNRLTIGGTDTNILQNIVNVNDLNNLPTTAYGSKANARAAVTSASGLRTQGQIITYLLSDGWYTEQFIGADTDDWADADNWLAIAPVTVGQNSLTIGGNYAGEMSTTYDVTLHNSGATFASLSALLSDANLATLIPANVRQGGMSIKFVQTSDNKYVQYRLMATSFSTSVTDWQGVDDAPTTGSENLVKSGGVAQYTNEISQIIKKAERVFNVNLLNLAGLVQNKLIDESGDITPSYDYSYTELIPVTEGMLLGCYSVGSGLVNFRCITAYSDTNTILPESGSDTAQTYTVPTGVNYIRMTIVNYYQNTLMIIPNYDSGIAYTYSPFNGYYYYDFSDSCEGLNDKITANTSDINGLKDDYEMVEYQAPSDNLLNLASITENVYIGEAGGESPNTDYGASDYIPVASGLVYTFQTNSVNRTIRTINQIAGYDENKHFVSGSYQTYGNSYTPPSGVKYIRFSTNKVYFTGTYYIAFVQSATVVPYEPYTPEIKKRLLKQALVPFTQQNIPSGVRYKFNISSNTFTNTDEFQDMCAYGINFRGDLSTFAGLEIGRGKGDAYGSWIKIDATKVYVYIGTAANPNYEYTHNISSFTDYIFVRLQADYTAHVTIEISTNGYSWSQTGVPFDARRKFLYVTGNSGTVINNCQLSFYVYGLEKDTYLYGDSYFTVADNIRWPYFLLQAGYRNLLLNGYPGRASLEAYRAFLLDLAHGKPKRVLWCMGMNNPDNGAVNANWLAAVEDLISKCEIYQIELILATIPNTPTNDNSYKNAWVRNSGYRYIDFASAVGASEDNTWYSGMLYTDNVHPTQQGAIALYTQAISDVPELMSK